MAEPHYVDEALLRNPRSALDQVIEHHCDLRDWSANVYETQHKKVQKHLSPGGRAPIARIEVDRSFFDHLASVRLNDGFGGLLSLNAAVIHKHQSMRERLCLCPIVRDIDCCDR